VERHSGYRALQALATRGLIQLRRKRGRNPVAIIKPPVGPAQAQLSVGPNGIQNDHEV